MYCKQRSISPPAGIVCLYIFVCYHYDDCTLNHSTCRRDPCFTAPFFIVSLHGMNVNLYFMILNYCSLKRIIFILNPFCLSYLIPQNFCFYFFFYFKMFYLCLYPCILLFPSRSHIPSKDPVLIWFELFFSHCTKTISQGR